MSGDVSAHWGAVLARESNMLAGLDQPQRRTTKVQLVLFIRKHGSRRGEGVGFLLLCGSPLSISMIVGARVKKEAE